MKGSRLWPVFAAYVLAFVAIVLASLVAIAVVRSMEPDVPDRAILTGLPGLLAGGIASSTALILTVLVVARPLDPGRLRLRPGRETGPALAIAILGVLALGQTLDSLTVLAGLERHGTMPAIRHALGQAVGPDLFVAVLIIGFLAGFAEEVFFRGYMETRLLGVWPARWAIVATSAAFGFLHLEWLHAALAFCLGLYLGYITELTGSALPAIACHIVNNSIFTVLTVTTPAFDGFWPNAGLAGACFVLFAGCVVWLARTLGPGLAPPPPV